MNKVPDCGNLYICGLDALDDPELLTQAGITHILSVLEFDYCDYAEFDKYRRMLILAEDHPLQDVCRYFQLTNNFIDSALAPPPAPQDSSAVFKQENAVVVHCAMGQSRSATVVCAYMMYKLRVTGPRALQLLQSSRPMCAPNEGFMAQLMDYEKFLGVAGTAAAGPRVVAERDVCAATTQTPAAGNAVEPSVIAGAAVTTSERAAV